MEIDFSALASRVAAFSDVLGCIILSTDGLVLGSFPPADGDGDGIKKAWLRFAAIGEPERGFVKIDNQLWAYVSSGSYAAFAVAAGSTRPGILLDHLEQTLLVAGESREHLAVGRPPGRVELVAGTKPKAVAGPSAPGHPAPAGPGSGGSASPPHAAPKPIVEPVARPAAQPVTQPVARQHVQPPSEGPDGARSEPAGDALHRPTWEPASPSAGEPPSGEPAADPEPEPEPEPPSEPEETEIDPVALAREFAGLLQEDSRRDEDNP